MSASYPNSVKVFTSRNSGDVIQPAHVNDLQDEVNAIEAGLLGGTASFTSSNSTFANVSVSGKSTFAGSAVFNGDVTFSTVVTANAQPRCRVFHGSTQTSTNNEENVLTFNSEDYDVGGLHSTAANPTRLTLPSTGVWLFGAVCNFAANNGMNYIRFRKNGATAMGSAAGHNAGSIGSRIHHTVIEQISTISDYVEVIAYHNDGFTAQMGNASSRVDQNEFWTVKLW